MGLTSMVLGEIHPGQEKTFFTIPSDRTLLKALLGHPITTDFLDVMQQFRVTS